MASRFWNRSEAVVRSEGRVPIARGVSFLAARRHRCTPEFWVFGRNVEGCCATDDGNCESHDDGRVHPSTTYEVHVYPSLRHRVLVRVHRVPKQTIILTILRWKCKYL